jgi:hypothetical protein
MKPILLTIREELGPYVTSGWATSVLSIERQTRLRKTLLDPLILLAGAVPVGFLEALSAPSGDCSWAKNFPPSANHPGFWRIPPDLSAARKSAGPFLTVSAAFARRVRSNSSHPSALAVPPCPLVLPQPLRLVARRRNGSISTPISPQPRPATSLGKHRFDSARSSRFSERAGESPGCASG